MPTDVWHNYCLPLGSWLKLLISAGFVLSVYISFCSWYLEYHKGAGTTFAEINCGVGVDLNLTQYRNWTKMDCQNLLYERNEVDFRANPVKVFRSRIEIVINVLVGV
jgi:hypothetical protein